MEILTAKETRKADQYTIENEPIASIDLMERAASRCFERIRSRCSTNSPIHVIAGPGNNGGDGLVIARYLINAGYEATVHLLRFTKNASEAFNTNLERLQELGQNSSLTIHDIGKAKDLTELPSHATLVDAIFGTGLSRPAEGLAASAIHWINNAGATVIAVDMPSGLFAENNEENDSRNIVKASHTFTFQTPKLAFMFPENAIYLGEWEVIPIGLDRDYIAQLDPNYLLLENALVQPLLKPRGKFSHKGSYGHSLLIAGAYGKMGAAVLAGKGSLRAGTGLLTYRIPRCGYGIVQSSVPEALCDVDEDEERITAMRVEGKFDAIGVGPGIGKDAPTQRALKALIQNAQVPLVMDADALNILGENKTWNAFLPAGSILTPHPGEFRRLVGDYGNDHEKLSMQREFARKNNVYLILKEAHTSIASPSGKVYFNNTGNPGMATGGSGDVLTGILTGLIARGYRSWEAAILGIYLHGLSGDLALKDIDMESLTAGDLVAGIGEAFKALKKIDP